MDNLRFAMRLKELREKAGLSQPELAKRIGVSVRTISRLETGVQEPTWPLVQSLSDEFGVTCESFRKAAAKTVRPASRGRPKSK